MKRKKKTKYEVPDELIQLVSCPYCCKYPEKFPKSFGGGYGCNCCGLYAKTRKQWNEHCRLIDTAAKQDKTKIIRRPTKEELEEHERTGKPLPGEKWPSNDKHGDADTDIDNYAYLQGIPEGLCARRLGYNSRGF